MADCTSERETFELSQKHFAEAKEEHDAAAKEMSDAKLALAQCEGSGGPMSIHSIFDMHVRIRNNGGTGSGNVIGETDSYWIVETNHHVAGGVGKRNSIDIWQGGDLLKRGVPAVVVESWFKSSQSVDISTLHLSKADVGDLILPVVPYATENDAYEPKIGDHGFFGACAEGLWPRPRSGNILDVRGGLIYYEPNAIGGDSGSAVVGIVNGQLKCIGRTAWSTRGSGGTWVGLAMSWRRIEQIKRGEVGDWDLPSDTKYPGDVRIQDDHTYGL